jgi:hypothetical protein
METRADLLDRAAVCRFFGGTRPLNPATLYRGIRKGRFPAPGRVWRENQSGGMTSKEVEWLTA